MKKNNLQEKLNQPLYITEDWITQQALIKQEKENAKKIKNSKKFI